jgi:hypothetical protein
VLSRPQGLISVGPWITRRDSLRILAHKVRYKSDSIEERDAAVERLREFLWFNYVTGTETARRIGVRDTTLYSWLQGKSRPRFAAAARIVAFLESLPVERAGIMPIGYEYREYKNWRGFPSRDVVRFASRQRARYGR